MKTKYAVLCAALLAAVLILAACPPAVKPPTPSKDYTSANIGTLKYVPAGVSSGTERRPISA